MKYSREHIERIHKKYMAGESSDELAKQYGFKHRHNITLWFKKYNLEIKKQVWNKGLTSETNSIVKRIAKLRTGMKHSENTKEKMRLAKIGYIPWNKNRKLEYMSNEKHPYWKGNAVGYSALHWWIRRKLGKANGCWICHVENKSRYHWANISGLYNRDFNDWVQLCVQCHKRCDGKAGWFSFMRGGVVC